MGFPIERQVFLREYRNGWFRVRAYTISRLLTTNVFQMLYSGIFAVIAHFMVGFPLDGFPVFMGCVLLMGGIGATLGLFVGTVVSDVSFANTVVPPLNVPLIIFSGFLQKPGNIKPWFKPLYYASPYQYGFSSLLANTFDRPHQNFMNCTLNVEHCLLGIGVIPTQSFSNLNEVHSRDILFNVCTLLGFFVVTIVSVHLAMKIAARRKQ